MRASYDQSARAIRAELRGLIGEDELRRLHRRSGWRHALVGLRQLALLSFAVIAILRWGEHLVVWVPASVMIGFVVFSWTILLHEVVHGTVTARARPHLRRGLGMLYAMPSGLAASQFSRWHLDHHQWLGNEVGDPKRQFLTPRRGTRWFKALYLTPALFPIYFRAARQAIASYPADLQRRIGRERRLSVLFHLGLLTSLVVFLGWPLALKLYVVPVFFVFPVAFTLNRLGQHYDVDPTDPARWGTLMRRSPLFWDWIFLWSNYHLEHHIYPGVPMYRLPALRRALDPFFREHGAPERTYTGLLWDWFVKNREPHTNWSLPAATPPAAPLSSTSA